MSGAEMTGFLGGNDWVFGAEVSGAGMTGFLGGKVWVFGAKVLCLGRK